MEHIKYKMEFDMKSTPVSILWDYISSENGLKQWFADNVKIKDKDYTFIWKGYSQEAKMVGMRKGLALKLQWLDAPSRTYFEMRILTSEMTDNTVLQITDFAEEDEMDESQDLWRSQIDTLRRVIGCK
ncbi:MAG: hypothetical protein IJ352_06525 [Muribaculaceae bacterium]|nr:hypothetical protein [Muribaculaceae bacterium]MBQ3606054.1 hypothetical protein [Muribaculaceae bacterium]MBQ7854657.1 hypothetical protein [Muribaculaceae bacterium]MBR3830817.1 hypothetical protein [Muribaculaceae bacterium]